MKIFGSTVSVRLVSPAMALSVIVFVCLFAYAPTFFLSSDVPYFLNQNFIQVVILQAHSEQPLTLSYYFNGSAQPSPTIPSPLGPLQVSGHGSRRPRP